MGSAYATPSFDSFTKMLILEQSKLIALGILKSSTPHASVAKEGNQGKGSNKKQKKSKPKPHIDQAQNKSFSKDDSCKEKSTCAYCKRTGHEEHFCYKKDIDELKHLLKKNNIDLPSRMSESTSSNSKYLGSTKRKGHAGLTFESTKGKGKAICASTSCGSGRWLLDFGASHHMAST